MANTIIWNRHDFVNRMRARIAAPSTWRDVMNVIHSASRSITNAYMSTEPSLQTGTRGTAYGYSDFAITAEVLTIDQFEIIPMLVDEADRNQQDYVGQMKIAEFQGDKISERIETLVLAQHASWKNFGVTDLAGGAADDDTAIAVSAANIDDMIRAIKRKLYQNNGVDLAVKHGIFIVWRAADFELLEAFVQANGFTEADIGLKNGIPVQKAFRYMGVDHYLSNSHTAGHVFAGIKRMGDLGILRGTFGKAKFIEDPGLVSGLGIVSRLDHGFDWPAQRAEFFMDVRVT